MKLSQEEFNSRCYAVFNTQEGDEYYSITVTDKNKISIYMSEVTNDKIVFFLYEPNMTDRPQALDYLLGNRENFND